MNDSNNSNDMVRIGFNNGKVRILSYDGGKFRDAFTLSPEEFFEVSDKIKAEYRKYLQEQKNKTKTTA